jgi:hypothetical protein
MDFSKTKKKKKTKKKDLDEFIAEDEKKKAEDKENGIRSYQICTYASVLFIVCSKECVYRFKSFENVIFFSKHAPLRLKGSRKLVRIAFF